MRAPLPRLLSSVAIACALAACVKTYVPPGPNEPAALLKLRRVFHAMPGTQRALRVYVDEALLFEAHERAQAAPIQTSAQRVYPGAPRVTFASSFWHTEMRLITETYTEQVPYTETETYFETSSQTCLSSSLTCPIHQTRTRTVTKYRSQTKTRSVWKPVDVIDDACQRFSVRTFEPGHVYLLQYTYAGASRCTISCLEQVPAPTPDGSSFKPCRAPP